MRLNLEVWEKTVKFALKNKCDNSSVGRASASQAESRGFESRLSLHRALISAMRFPAIGSRPGLSPVR